MYSKLGISEDVVNLSKKVEIEIKPIFEKIDEVCEYNSLKVLEAFQKYNISDMHFGSTTGYGYGDIGRDTIEKVFARVLGTEDAIVRSQFISGTHALTVALFAFLRPNDTFLSISGKPYDTLDEVIGIQENKSSLKSFGVKYEQIDLIDSDFDYEEIEKRVLDVSKKLEIDHLLSRKPKQLSLGQQQRVAIAKALIKNPDIYLFDEPLSNLDPLVKIELKKLIKQIKEVERGRIKEYVSRVKNSEYFGNSKDIWSVKCFAAFPCATQNEIDEKSAELLVSNGAKYVCEGANMPSTLGAIEIFKQAKIVFLPAKAANAGGVATSALEMAQSSQRLYWSFDEVDGRLRKVMAQIYANIDETAKRYGVAGDYLAGANIAGFERVAQAMTEQGII